MVNAPSDALKNFGLGIGFDYTGKRNGDLFNELNIVGAPFRTDETPFLLPSYTKVDLAFFYRDPKRKWEISLKINNVLDTMYIRQSTVPFAVVMAPGRNILGNVTYRF
jgi:outer membrane receptor protein involved in Fe transport